MEARTILSPTEARSFMSRFDVPSDLIEEGVLIDIINRLDSIAYLYITSKRKELESSNNPHNEDQLLQS